jgi:signal transduction histidine kinase
MRLDIVNGESSSAEARDALERMVDEQSALRRVATLVARGVPPVEVFYAVSVEVAQLVGADHAHVARFDDDRAFVLMGLTTESPGIVVGSRFEFQDWMTNAEVQRTGHAARSDGVDWSSVDSAYGAAGRRLGVVSLVSAPIVVTGHLWGEITVTAREPLPPDTEVRLQNFTELAAMAIANAESRAELAASSRRIVTASDEARRRIERNLHDGTQQRLVALALAVRAVADDAPADLTHLHSQLSQIAAGLGDAAAELQEISRGIHPANLSQSGLSAALRTLARRSPIPVDLEITIDERLPESVEVAAYYLTSEALANAAKHAQASRVEVSLSSRVGAVFLSIRDDGIGGADPVRGSGLVGLVDRVRALGGTIDIDSPQGRGTHIVAVLAAGA